MARILTSAAVTVTTGATRLLASNQDAEYRAIGNGNATLYIGGAGVATASGFIMAANAVMTFQGADYLHSGLPNGEIWGIVTTGTLSVRTLEAQ